VIDLKDQATWMHSSKYYLLIFLPLLFSPFIYIENMTAIKNHNIKMVNNNPVINFE
jgi:hypothetical protein